MAWPGGLSAGLMSAGDDVQAVVHELVESGEAHLLRAEALRKFELHTNQVRRGAIDIVMAELSQLHAQLHSITTQCTLIIGFGLASIGADTLSVLAGDDGQFCIYKSGRARALGTAYILLTSVCICMCMSVITTAQIITFLSTRASFTYAQTQHIVQMTSILMHGDHRSKSQLEQQGAIRVWRPFTIYSTFFLALVCFFLCTVLIVWIFLGTDNWVKLNHGQPAAQIHRPPANGTIWNEYVKYTNDGQYMVRCSNPYDAEESQMNDAFATGVAWAHTATFLLCLLFGLCQARFVSQQFTDHSLARQFGARRAQLRPGAPIVSPSTSEVAPPLEEVGPN